MTYCNKVLFSVRINSSRIFFAIAITIFALSIPTLLVHEIVPFKHFTTVNENYTINLIDNITYYTVGLIPQATDNSCRLFKANLWLTGIFFKVSEFIITRHFIAIISLKMFSKISFVIYCI